ncbi:MAG TPA: FadR/GntR family transcriptional regulator [Trebonia sp.]|jgi:DNA-binding FadR family transcriptional regulator
MTAPARKEFRPFTPAEPQRAFDIIASQLRDRLKTGELRPGDRLPAERELGEHFQVSRNTLREAVRMLEVTGLVEVRRGVAGGVFVADANHAMFTRAISDLMTLSPIDLSDLLEVRLWLGGTIARVACERGTEADFDVLTENINEAQRLGEAGDWEARSEVNHEFLNLLAMACHNPILLMVQRSITDVVREFVATVGPTRDTRLLPSKRKLVKALRQRDPDAAMVQMDAHINLVNGLWAKALEKK